MSTNRVVLPRPTSPASTLGAGGNVPNTLEPQRARAPQNITAQSPVTPVYDWRALYVDSAPYAPLLVAA